MHDDPSPSAHLAITEAADILDITPEHLTMLLDRERITYATAADGQRRIPREELDDYRRRQERGYAAMRESMLAAEQLADDE